MPNLNKTQKKFRKEIEELKKHDKFIDIMYNNDSYYNNKGYQNIENYRKSKNKSIILYIIIILIFILPLIFKNKELILSKIEVIKSLNNKSNFYIHSDD